MGFLRPLKTGIAKPLSHLMGEGWGEGDNNAVYNTFMDTLPLIPSHRGMGNLCAPWAQITLIFSTLLRMREKILLWESHDPDL